MRNTVFHRPLTPFDEVQLHVWNDHGFAQDVLGVAEDHGLLRFEWEQAAEDVRRTRFKFVKIHNGSARWERDEYIRQFPTTGVQHLWTFDYTSRVLTTHPFKGSLPDEIELSFVTQRFAAGWLYAWNPRTGESRYISETRRDEERNVSVFRLASDAWMAEGFFFKLTSANRQDWEGDREFTRGRLECTC